MTGASQGVGRGIVEGLCEAGYRVFFTGRDRERLDTVAGDASKLGGDPIAMVVDHRDDAAVDALFDDLDARGDGLEILVNSCWGGYENMLDGDRFSWPDPFWRQNRRRWDDMFTSGVRAAFIASQRAVDVMRGSGLIVHLSSWAAQKHISNTLYGMAKAATDKMTSDMAHELRDTLISVISLYPGLVATERVRAAGAFDLSTAETPRFSGRVIAALANQPAFRNRVTGQVCVGAALAKEFDVLDVDGSSPTVLEWDDV